MKINAHKTVEINITLDEKEAQWLKSYVQNPQCPLEDEPPEDTQMRETIFNGIIKAVDISNDY